MRPENFLEMVSGDVTLIFHNDGDGVCSATLMYDYLKTKGARVKLFCGDIDKRTFERADLSEYVIMVDLAVDSYPEFFDRFKDKNVLIIDHHPIKRDLNEIGFVHINPRIKEPDKYISASEVVYYILKQVSEPKKWLARIGGVSDASIKDGNEKEIKASNMIAAIKAVLKSYYLPELVEFLSECNTIDDFITNQQYLKTADKFQKEVDKVVNDFEDEKHGDPIFYQIDTQYPMKAVIANILFEKYPNNTVFVYREYNGVFKISGRSNKVDLGRIMKKASAGIGHGGGHPKASAASVTDFELFRKRVLTMI